MFNWLVALWHRNKKQCSHCGSWDTEHGTSYARGWNQLCEQAYADAGVYCHKCFKITWDTPLEEHMKTLPDWCVPHSVIKTEHTEIERGNTNE